MSDQHYLMTEEQIQELKTLDLPYCPSVFQQYRGNFKKYCAYMRLRGFRSYGWNDSEDLELSFQRFYADPVVQRLGMIKWDGEKVIDLYEEAMKNDKDK